MGSGFFSAYIFPGLHIIDHKGTASQTCCISFVFGRLYYALYFKESAVSRFFTILGMIFTGVIGTFLHFLFQWTANHPAIALFSPVNESIWEHLKLLFFPVLLFTSLECILYKRRVSGFLWARTMALLAGLGFIIAGFYIYSGILGTNYTAADIGLFVISILITFLLTPYLQKRQKSFASPTGLAFSSYFY